MRARCKQYDIPDVILQDSVQPLVERSGRVVACPVVILAVSVHVEVPAQRGVTFRDTRSVSPCALPHSVKVITQHAKLCLK